VRIDLYKHDERRRRAIQRVREREIIIPTFAEMKEPALIPSRVKDELAHISLWEVNPYNLFRITWHNQPVPEGGAFSHAW
jgi:cysteine synthase A